MSYGMELKNNNGETCYSTEFKSSVYQGKLNPVVVQVNGSYSIRAFFVIPFGYTNILPFFSTGDSSPVSLLQIRYNPTGLTSLYSAAAQSGTTLSFNFNANFLPGAGNWGYPRIGDIVKGATILSFSVAGSSVTINFNSSISFASAEQLQSTSLAGTYSCIAAVQSANLSLSNYVLRIFSTNVSSSSSGYGMQMFDSSGNFIFNSNNPILSISASYKSIASSQGAVGSPTTNPLPTFSVDSGSIPSNYSVMQTVFGRLLTSSVYAPAGENPYTSALSAMGLSVVRASSTTIQVSSCGLTVTGYVGAARYWNINGNVQSLFIDNSRYP